MKQLFLMVALFATLATGAVAQKLGPPGTFDPPVINMNPPADPPAEFSWDGAYVGGSTGQSEHTREYSREEVRHWQEEVDREEVTEREQNNYGCVKGVDYHFGPKCDITGLTVSESFNPLIFVNSPWNSNQRDETVRYTNGYDGLWMGGMEPGDVFKITMNEYVETRDRGDRWAQLEYFGTETIYDVRTWTETVDFSETFTVDYEVTHQDMTFGVFAGYRKTLFEMAPGVSVVGGLEVNFFKAHELDETFTQFGAQGGLALGRNLTFAEVGADHVAVGNDYAWGREGNLMTGVRYWASDDENDSGTQFRVAYKF